ncbi:MAG: hypothetical protein K1X57_13820 [Gemmataceae bacterium]|nr:hypothetical protein [Gemmataceae bacterium]
MIHYSCDMCGKDLASEGDARFVVRVEVYAAHDPAELTTEDLDADAVQSLSELLADAPEGADLSAHLPPTRNEFRYDLCPSCHRRYVRNPLARETSLQFSEN